MYPCSDVTCLFLADDGSFASKTEKGNFLLHLLKPKTIDVNPEDVARSQPFEQDNKLVIGC